MKRKETVYKGLQFIDVYFEDTSPTSPEYFQITEFPTRLTAGKNLFKLRGHPDNLRVGGVLNIEILDYNGDPIYYEIIDYLEEDKSRVVAIYIYSETSPGDCTITLIAEAELIEGLPAPQQWQGRPNIRWKRTIPVNPNISNDTEIIFAKLPELEITEQVGVQLDRIYPGGQQFPTYATGKVRYFALNGAPAVEISGGLFTSDMSTGTITISSPINPTPTPNFPVVSTPYTSTIKKILSSTTALLDTQYVVYSSQSLSPQQYIAFDYSTFSLDYEAMPTYVATENSQSFALIQIKGLEPNTGDVSRVKVYTTNKGTVGTWEQVNDVELEETEIFVSNTASLFPDQSIGIFTSQSIINTYWEGFTYLGKTTTTPPTLTWTTASLNNALSIVSAVDISATTTVHVVKQQDSFAGFFIESSSYKVTIDALGTRTADALNPRLSVYLSGSAVAFDSTDLFNQEFSKILGKKIGELEVTSDSQRFDDVVFNFITDYDGTATLLFVVEAGQWQIADIRTTTDNDIGYSPNYTRIKSLINTPHKANNQISFKIEYYNVAGVKSKQISYVYDKNWEGGNRYIDGDYSMLTGSLYVADTLESGVAISGYKNTGFVRSLGYEGFAAEFPGFLLWSGSALSGSSGTKGGNPYSGVGLELYANPSNYLRYSTADSELDVHTDNIFIGNTQSFISASNGNILISGSNIGVSTPNFFLGNNANFISGSNGNIRISGSNVGILTPNFLLGNNSNFISGSGGNIRISGSNVEVLTPKFLLGSLGTQFISGSNGKLEISSSNFHLKPNGDVTASNMYLQNVAIADGFVYQTVVVNNSNYTQYFENYTISGLAITGSTAVTKSFTKLIMDGSKGGASVSQIRLERQPDWPIGMIIPPGYASASINGYTATIENWSLSQQAGFGQIYLANAVASGSDPYDFGIHSDMWDVVSSGFASRRFTWLDIRGLTNSTQISVYGENDFDTINTYYFGGSDVARSQTIAVPYGGLIRLQRTTAGATGFNLKDSYWQIVNTDDYRGLRQYFGSLKLGNGGTLIGGQDTMGSRFSDVHYTKPHSSAILQLDAGQNTTAFAEGSGSVFILPRITTSQRNNVGDPVAGSMIYNITTNKLQVYDGTAWQDCW